MHWVKLVDLFLHIPKSLRKIPAGPYLTLTRPLYKIMELPVASLRVKDPVDFPILSVVDDRRLLVRSQLASGRRCLGVEQRDVEHVVLPDCIRKI
jgi:hypothetical protein